MILFYNFLTDQGKENNDPQCSKYVDQNENMATELPLSDSIGNYIFLLHLYMRKSKFKKLANFLSICLFY